MILGRPDSLLEIASLGLLIVAVPVRNGGASSAAKKLPGNLQGGNSLGSSMKLGAAAGDNFFGGEAVAAENWLRDSQADIHPGNGPKMCSLLIPYSIVFCSSAGKVKGITPAVVSGELSGAFGSQPTILP